jgi:RNA polymerase sigma-70 factor (subfamily 1)
MAQTSVDLLERARAGSNEALGALLQRCERKLIALVRLRLGPSLRRELDSRDLVQTTLVKALSHFGEFAGSNRGSLMAWLARIAENEVRDQASYYGRDRRDAARRVSLEASPEALTLAARVRSQTSLLAHGEQVLALERALESLSPEHRDVIVMRAIEEHDFPEIAEKLGRSADACRMLFTRALTALTLAMGPRR